MTGRTTGIAWALAAFAGGAALAQVSPSAGRAELMHQQLRSVMGAHDAIIRGDLEGARNQARSAAHLPDPVGLPQGATSYLDAIRSAAARAEGAPNLQAAADATASMLSTCGECHRAVGTMPALPQPPQPSVGGVVGHMVAHQGAMDLLLQGLTTPSTSLWNEGADALSAAALAKNKMPSDPKISGHIMKSEKEVHALAARARHAEDTSSRAGVYSALMQSCATCHGVNSKGYGPTLR
jgi:cytochrome c553